MLGSPSINLFFYEDLGEFWTLIFSNFKSSWMVIELAVPSFCKTYLEF
jgi:hypothetical protein